MRIPLKKSTKGKEKKELKTEAFRTALSLYKEKVLKRKKEIQKEIMKNKEQLKEAKKDLKNVTIQENEFNEDEFLKCTETNPLDLSLETADIPTSDSEEELDDNTGPILDQPVRRVNFTDFSFYEIPIEMCNTFCSGCKYLCAAYDSVLPFQFCYDCERKCNTLEKEYFMKTKNSKFIQKKFQN